MLFGILTVFSISVLFTTEAAYAWCIPSSDWPDRPCYAPYFGLHLEQEKLDFEPYYDHKGKQWMDTKLQQLQNSVQNNSLDLWLSQSEEETNYNVYTYYFLQGEVPNRYGYSFEEALKFEKAWNTVESNSKYAPIHLWNYHDVILDGTVIETDIAQMVSGEGVPLHTIKVNQYFKGEQKSEIITASDNFNNFDINLFENGLFYLKKIDSQSWYSITRASVATFGNCDARELIEITPVLPNEKPAISSPAGPTFIDRCVPNYFKIDPDELPPNNIQTGSDELGKRICFGGPSMILNENCVRIGTYDGATGDEIFYPPLKQIKKGIAIQDIKCNEGKFLIHKRITLSPACVSDNAWSSLIKPPYAWAKLRIGAPAEEITQEKLCNWYPNVPLVQMSCEEFK